MGVGLGTAGSAGPDEFALLAAEVSGVVGDNFVVVGGIDADLNVFEQRNEEENFG